MAPYKVYFNRAAEDAFKKLPRSVQQQLQPHIDALATEPRPPSSKLLYGKERTYRVRSGDYRLLYQVDDAEREVVIVAVGNRSIIYRGK